jgi:hypothetical protein
MFLQKSPNVPEQIPEVYVEVDTIMDTTPAKVILVWEQPLSPYFLTASIEGEQDFAGET